MDIIHIRNLGDISRLYCEQQRKLGHNAVCMEYRNDFYPADIVIQPNLNHKKSTRIFENSIQIYKKCIKDFDVIHFHHEPSFIGHSFLKYGGYDYPFLKLFKKKILLQYHGVYPMKFSNFFTKYLSNQRFVSTPNQLEYDKDAILLRDPVDINKFHYQFKENEKKIIILTACISKVHEKIKGTEYMRRTIKKLQNEGYNIELKIIEKVPYNEAVELYKQADIIIDQLILGWHGLFAVECMLLGKPVCCYIDERYDSYINDNGIVKVTKENLAEQLKPLIEDNILRRIIGQFGRIHAMRYHSVESCTDTLMRYLK